MRRTLILFGALAAVLAGVTSSGEQPDALRFTAYG